MRQVKKIQNTDTNSVRNYVPADDNAPLLFSFAQFNLKPIKIDEEFNNFFKDEQHYIQTMYLLMGKALPLLSREKASLFSGDFVKADVFHMHKVHKKKTLIERILLAYNFPIQNIDNIFEGDEVYQIEIPYLNGATRIIFQRISNLISFLFLDTNHHLYLNEIKTSVSGSLFYEFCPKYLNNECNIMQELRTCYAFDFLDEQKIISTLSYKYEPHD